MEQLGRLERLDLPGPKVQLDLLEERDPLDSQDQWEVPANLARTDSQVLQVSQVAEQ